MPVNPTPPVIHAGDAVWITARGKRLGGEVLMASPNSRSLLVAFDGALWGNSGMFVSSVPLLWDEGEYHSLDGGIFDIEPRE